MHDLSTGKKHEFIKGEGFTDFINFYHAESRIVGHNIINYDWPVLRKHFPFLSENANLYDTLVVSRLMRFKMADGLGHSLDAWGRRLRSHKGEFKDFSKLSPEMIEYCWQDVNITRLLYEFQQGKNQDGSWNVSIETEHRAARLCYSIHKDGFGFDIDKARTLHVELSTLRDTLHRDILAGFPPRVKFIKEVTPKETKNGTLSTVGLTFVPPDDAGVRDLSAFIPGAPFSRIEFVPFNPGSPSQVVERLNELGWKPVDKTKSHLLAERERDAEAIARFRITGWKTNERNLSTLPDTAPPEAQKLAQYLCVKARVEDLEEWIGHYNQSTRAIHGTIIPINAWTHRVSHRSPNTGNIARVFKRKDKFTPVEAIKFEYDARLRELWCAHDGYQVGADMDACHLRVLAHLMGDPDFTAGVIAGDPHTKNLEILKEIVPHINRDEAKVFIYTFINGGGSTSVSRTFRCSMKEAKAAIECFVSAFPGLDELMNERIPFYAKRGWFEGIDGRKVVYEQEHGMISGLLQNAEVVMLKHSAWHGLEQCKAEGIPMRFLNLVHDEVQMQVHSEDKSVAERAGQIMIDQYRMAGEFYNMRCPISGGYKVGKNWRDCH